MGKKKKEKANLSWKRAVHIGYRGSGMFEKQRGCMEDVRVLLWIHVSKPDKSVSWKKNEEPTSLRWHVISDSLSCCKDAKPWKVYSLASDSTRRASKLITSVILFLRKTFPVAFDTGQGQIHHREIKYLCLPVWNSVKPRRKPWSLVYVSPENHKSKHFPADIFTHRVSLRTHTSLKGAGFFWWVLAVVRICANCPKTTVFWGIFLSTKTPLKPI